MGGLRKPAYVAAPRRCVSYDATRCRNLRPPAAGLGSKLRPSARLGHHAFFFDPHLDDLVGLAGYGAIIALATIRPAGGSVTRLLCAPG